MKIVFVSNYYNHHQSAFSEAMHNLIGDGYKFVETMPIEQERLDLGWGEDMYPCFVMRSYISDKAYSDCLGFINDADIVVAGSAPEAMLHRRIKERKIVFRYSERPLKTKIDVMRYLKMLIRLHQLNPYYANIYLLCASAYTSVDFSKFGLFKGRCYKWGYFPSAKRYENIDRLISRKKKHSILWAGRFLDWKHPEAVIETAKNLKNDGYDFDLKIIGTGELEEALTEMIRANELSNCVHMLGSMKPAEVRDNMEQSEIYLFTSDKVEGWGAVLNESMNSGCAVVASHVIGSVPFLLKDGENGLIYRDGELDDLYQKTKWLLDYPTERMEMSKKAYWTIRDEWNAENAAQKLLHFSEKVISGKSVQDLYLSGVCSPAEIIHDRWY